MGATLSLIVGGWCLLGRIARLGVIADLLSQPLLVGYLAGAAVLMVVGQLGKMTGTTVESRVLGSAWPQHGNRPIAQAMHKNILQVGMPQWSEADQLFAREFQKSQQQPEVGLRTEVVPSLADHKVYGQAVMSAASFAEMALAAGCEALGLPV